MWLSLKHLVIQLKDRNSTEEKLSEFPKMGTFFSPKNTRANALRRWRGFLTKALRESLVCYQVRLGNTGKSNTPSVCSLFQIPRMCHMPLVVSPGKRAPTLLHLERKGKLARMRLQFKLIPPAASIQTIIQVRKWDIYEALFGNDTQHRACHWLTTDPLSLS